MNSNGNKTVIFILLVVLMIFCGNFLPAYAVENKTISMEDVSVEKGDSVKTDVVIDNPQYVTGFTITVSYDSSKLEVSKGDVKNGSLFNGFIEAHNVVEDVIGKKSRAMLSVASADAITSTDKAVLLTIDFKAKSDAAAGDVLVNINGDIKVDYDGEPATFKLNADGVIKITSEAGPENPEEEPPGTGGNPGSGNPGGGSGNPDAGTGSQTVIPPADVPADVPEFSDLGNYQWAVSAIRSLAQKNIMMGIGGGQFAPSANVRRGDYMLMVIRMLGLQNETAQGNFADVPAGSYYYNALAVAKAKGFATGVGENKFNPGGEITREDLFVLTYRILAAQGVIDEGTNYGGTSVLDKYADKSSISEYAREPIAGLVSMGLIEGSGGVINPKNRATRAETAVFLERVYTFMQGRQ